MQVYWDELEEQQFDGKTYHVSMQVGKWEESIQMVSDSWVLTSGFDAMFDDFKEAFTYAETVLLRSEAEQMLNRAIEKDSAVDALQFEVDELVWEDGVAFMATIVGVYAWKIHDMLVTSELWMER